jgi:hypothetical protein
MSEKTVQEMTHTVGYYNGAKWQVQVYISRPVSITLTLKGGEYILDREGRKVNDPFFEIYVKNKQLCRETSDTPVPLLRIPNLEAQAVASTNPVRAASKFALDAHGVRKPVMPKASIAVAPEINAEPVKGMSMDEARKLGLARKIRIVPEDYGQTDTDGAPPRLPPPIRYSIDPTMLKKPTPLPAALLKVESKGITDAPARSQLISQLSKSSAAPAAPASANLFLNQTTVNVPANSPLIAGKPSVRPPTPEPEDILPDDVPDQPEPAAGAEEEVQFVTEPDALVAGLPEPDVTELQESEPLPSRPPTKPMTPSDRFICLACGKPYKFRSQLVKHVNHDHPDKADELLSQYPAE